MRMDPVSKSTGQTKSWTTTVTTTKSKTTTDAHMKEKPKSEDRRKHEKSQKDARTDTYSKYSSEFLRQKLREYFHHTDFKSTLQKEAIKEIMQGTKRRKILRN